MQINTNLALMPVNYDVQPVSAASKRSVGSYEKEQDNFVRISFSGSKFDRIGKTYGKIGNEVENKGMGGNVDLYV